MTTNAYQPKPADKFSFGLWTLGNRGRDPFGDFVRPTLPPVEIAAILGEIGAWGVNLHDNDLIPIDATTAERDGIVREFKKACKDSGIVVPMATVSLTSYFHADAEELAAIGATLLLGEADAAIFHNGFADQTSALWTPDGRLVANGVQITWYKE